MKEVVIEKPNHTFLVEYCEIREVRGHPVMNSELLNVKAQNFS